MGKIKIGTRGSKLALWQAERVAEALKAGGIESEIVVIETAGDKILDVAIGKIGSKGVFTEEIEDRLAAGEIDIAVHSAKDLQSELPAGFEIAAFVKREKPNDVLVGENPEVSLDDPGRTWLIGTSSTRRVSILKSRYPWIETIAVRGNLETRIRKMREGQCDALALAYAGVHRMGYDRLILAELPLEVFTPPAGQGCVAVEVHKSLDENIRAEVHRLANHKETEICVRAERAFLNALQGGCSIPVFANAVLQSGRLKITGGIISLDGQKIVRKEVVCSPAEGAKMGGMLGKEVLDDGGRSILNEIRGAL